MKFFSRDSLLTLSISALAVGLSACEQPKTSGDANSASANAAAVNSNSLTVNSNSAAVNAAVNAASSILNVSTVDAKEPEKYQATVMLKIETSGAQSMPIPPLKAEVARSGADRRMEFKLPTGETVIYLDKGGRQLIISPQKKQYAELNKESVGFDPRSLLMPEQIVNQIQRMKGVEKIGEETVDGRAAVKYRLASGANTQSQAGRVETESFILVDKETGLPLRSLTNASAQGEVKGVNALNVVTEMKNIRTDVDQSLFDEPADFQKVPPEQIRAQMNAMFTLLTTIIGQMGKSSQPAAPAMPSPTSMP